MEEVAQRAWTVRLPGPPQSMRISPRPGRSPSSFLLPSYSGDTLQALKPACGKEPYLLGD